MHKNAPRTDRTGAGVSAHGVGLTDEFSRSLERPRAASSGKRTRPPSIRHGTTAKLMVGQVTVYVTVNGAPPFEVFAKTDEGYQADADGLAEMASLALQYGCPPAVVVAHLRFRRYPPHGGPGQPVSISDAIGLAIERAENAAGQTREAKKGT